MTTVKRVHDRWNIAWRRPVAGLFVALVMLLISPFATTTRVLAQTQPQGQTQAQPPAAAKEAAPAATPAPQGTAPAATPPAATPPAGTAPAGTAPTQAQPAAPSAKKPAAPAKALNTDQFVPQAMLDAAEQQAAELTRLRKAVDRVKNSDAGLSQQRAEVEKIEAAARDTEQALQSPQQEVESQLKRLGAKPKAGDPPEPENVQRERARLETIRGQIEGAIKTANLTHLRARQLIGHIHELRLNNFTRNLFERRQSPLSSSLWAGVIEAWPRISRQFQTILTNWWQLIRPNAAVFFAVLGGSLLLYLLLHVVRRKVADRMLPPVPAEESVDFFRRAGIDLLILPVVAAPTIAAISAFYGGLELFGFTNSQIGPIIRYGWVSIALYAGVTALARVIFLPHYPDWRIFRLPDDAARRFLRLSRLIAIVYATDLFINGISRTIYLPFEFGIVATLLANIAFAALMLAATWVPIRIEADNPSSELVKRTFNWLKIPSVIIALVIVISTLSGYVAFGRFIAGQVLLTGSGALGILLCHLAIRAFTSLPEDDAEIQATGLFRGRVRLEATQKRVIAGLLSFVLNVALITFALGLLLLTWGFSQSALLGWLRSAFFGFEVGQFKISLFRIVISIALFLVVVFLTRLLQRWLSRSVLTPKRVDTGIANSIHQGIGYAGMGLAALIAVSHIGFDVTNLAIVAGALSVGIGFGLQAIVNNFLSGIILLVERPIKVGDWIVVGTNQGYVRKISVRATEIETFDRASVIVPNSELITGTVQNWTHRNAMGRIVINVGASYSADPEHVIRILTEIAQSSEHVLKFPEPFVVFEEFGASSLDFSLRCYIADVKRSLVAQTALRTAIHQQFRKEGIEIPFPQQDVHLRDLDIVRTLIQRAAEQRMQNATPPATTPEDPQKQDPTITDMPGGASPGDTADPDGDGR